MGRSQETFNKKEVRQKKEKKRKDKALKRLDRKENKKKSSLDDMIAYVDENGVITSTPPETKKEEIKAEDIEIGVPKREKEPEDLVRTGIVSYFNDSKGYGFIKDSKTKESVFVHINDVQGNISQGSNVSFEVEPGHKGPTAKNVMVS